ncbi:hypothetical protein CHCC20335_3614 [Bacillus paralicheniformis]|nr:hypothetical protein CHCC20335_3614 [Bacillus paralicheniformis]
MLFLHRKAPFRRGFSYLKTYFRAAFFLRVKTFHFAFIS